MRFDIKDLATAWRSVHVLDSGKDTPYESLILIEEHLDGVILVSTDMYSIMYVWVPSKGSTTPFGLTPSGDPLRRIVVHDPDSRAVNLLKYGQSVQKRRDKENPDQERLVVTLDLDAKPDAVDGQFTEMADHWISISLPDMELVKLGVSKSHFPDWRKHQNEFKPEPAEAVNLRPDKVAKLLSAAALHPESYLEWRSGGSTNAALFVLWRSEPQVLGYSMPLAADLIGESVPEDEEAAMEESA